VLRRKRAFESTSDADIHGFLAEGDCLSGSVDLHGGFRVDGKIVGKITSPSMLIVGPSGLIEAELLHVAALSVSGIVRGNIEVDERLEVHPGGKVYGRVRISRPGLVVAPGGILEATLEMEKTDVPQESMIQPGTTDSRPMAAAWRAED
jgi:cytoskeletal protein CcmA (bactofilin family)